jgi:hypothetical protein
MRKMSENSTQGRSHIDSIVRQEEQALEQRSVAERFADAVGIFAGSPFFIALHLALLTAWLLINSGKIGWIRPFDPYPFSLFAMIVAVEAVSLSSFILNASESNDAPRGTPKPPELANLLAGREGDHQAHPDDSRHLRKDGSGEHHGGQGDSRA